MQIDQTVEQLVIRGRAGKWAAPGQPRWVPMGRGRDSNQGGGGDCGGRGVIRGGAGHSLADAVP